MIFLENFILPDKDKEEKLLMDMYYENGAYPIDNTYPARIFSDKSLSQMSFSDVTILYGTNGSGKSTLLNLIAQRLSVKRTSPFNSSMLFDRFAKLCRYEMGYDDEGDLFEIPHNSRIITSDDVFDYMLDERTKNHTVIDNIDSSRDEWIYKSSRKLENLRSLDDYDRYKTDVYAKTMTRRQYVRNTLGAERTLHSNGETSLEYFDSMMKNDAIYLLDEPENSLSPMLQLELRKRLEKMARYNDCQFIIATHSPFILSLNNARIYDLDSDPVDIKKWYELENSRVYYRFFKDNEDFFE